MPACARTTYVTNVGAGVVMAQWAVVVGLGFTPLGGEAHPHESTKLKRCIPRLLQEGILISHVSGLRPHRRRLGGCSYAAESLLLGVLGVLGVLEVLFITWEIDPHCNTAVHDHESANSDGYPPEGRHLLCKIGD